MLSAKRTAAETRGQCTLVAPGRVAAWNGDIDACKQIAAVRLERGKLRLGLKLLPGVVADVLFSRFKR